MSHEVHDGEPGFCTKCKLEAEVSENAVLRAEVTDLKRELLRDKECHLADMRMLVERTRERDAALLQNGEAKRLMRSVAPTYCSRCCPEGAGKSRAHEATCQEVTCFISGVAEKQQ
jgi:hypothetical protein